MAKSLNSATLSPLDYKLVRDLWRMKGQAVAIALVIAVGVMLLVMMDGLVNSLSETKRAYYERYRLAEVFAPLKRAPEHLLQEVAEIPGVASVRGRMSGAALVNLPQIAVPIRAQALSLPDFGAPTLNDLFLSHGRLLDPTQEDEILLLEGFAKAHDLTPGDSISATMNGARRTFQIVGLAQSPEFLFSAPPGELMPDDARYAVIWMSSKAMGAAFDLDGAFNEALLSLARDADEAAVLAATDRLLAPYGGLGAYSVEDHVSDRFVQEEINGLQVTSKGVPPVFLAVAAFLLNIVITRMIESEREQIGLLKAFGYSSSEIGAHYLKFTLAIAAGGAVLGCVAGILAGRALVNVYLIYYKFPFLIFQVDPKALIFGFTVSVLAASAGGALVLRKVFALSPAVAMRPQAPADYSRGAKFGSIAKALLDQPSRMVMRRLFRQPGRTLFAVLGIAAGMSISVGMLGVLTGFDRVVELNFNVMDRSDVRVSFVEPVADKTVYELGRMEGVLAVEPFRNVSTTLRHGVYSHRIGLSGLLAEPRFNRAVDEQMRSIFIRDDGIILSQTLADILHVVPGQRLVVEVMEGRRPILDVPVVGIAQSLLGAPAYMELSALNRALKEPDRVSGAYLRVDAALSESLYIALKDMPVIAGVSLKHEARAAFQEMVDSGAGSTRYIMAAIAGIITFGIIYNSARIAFAERARDLASLRVIGFTRAEAAFVLLGELAVITLLALPLGCGLGYYLALAIAQGFSTELYQIPATIGPENYGNAIIVVLLASLFSGWLVKRDLDRVDLVSALKTRE